MCACIISEKKLAVRLIDYWLLNSQRQVFHVYLLQEQIQQYLKKRSKHAG